MVESSSTAGGNKIGVEVALEKHGLYMLGTGIGSWRDEDRQIGR